MKKGFKLSDETKIKMSLAHKGKIPWNRGLRGFIPWNKGLTKDVDSRLKSMSECKRGKKTWNKGLTKKDFRVAKNILGFLRLNLERCGKTYSELYGKEKASNIKIKMSKALRGRKNSKEHCYKISNSRSFLIRSGKITFSNCEKGDYFSYKNNRTMSYRSSFELQAFKLLEQLSAVEKYDYECISIPYEFGGNFYLYTPDILVTYTTGIQEIIEVKPAYMLNDKKTIAKISALKKYCTKRNIICSVWTEKELFVRKEIKL